MEVCGTHTRAILKSGIRYILPKEVLLMSGPGCPVCVTPESFIDIAISILDIKDVILVTFGDMIRDNICNRWQALQEIQTCGQLTLWEENCENQIVDDEDIKKKTIEHFSSVLVLLVIQ